MICWSRPRITKVREQGNSLGVLEVFMVDADRHVSELRSVAGMQLKSSGVFLVEG